MRLTRLTIAGVRCVRAVELQPCAGLNLLIGGNGAGKTSVLEAIYLLGAGKSFRFGGHDALLAHGASALQVYGELEFAGRNERVGFERSRAGWRGMRNGERVADLAELAGLVPVVCFSPESHELVGGGSEVRRRFFDWVVFHVEPGFADAHRRYGRVLRQRNALLKQSPDSAELASWTSELADAGEQLAEFRARVVPDFASLMVACLGRLLGELGSAELQYKRGWRDAMSLHERLSMLQSRELDLGHSLAGPHRADWSVEIGGRNLRTEGSRGQQKLVALAAVLVAAEIYAQRRGHPPIIALDDFGSELDQEHQQRALLECAQRRAQLWVTGTQRPAAVDLWPGERREFHVEQGTVSAHG